MVYRKVLLFHLLLSVLFCAWTPFSSAQPLRDFVADQVILDNGVVLENSKVYISGLKSRMNTIIGGLIVIVRRDKQLSWTLFPESKTYSEKPLTTQELKILVGEIPGEISRTRIGSERILGYNCTKYQVTFRTPRGTETALLWYADSIGMPIRTEVPNLATTELHNIRFGPQPASLFEIPAGYRKTDVAGGGTGIRGGVIGAGGAAGRGRAGTGNPPRNVLGSIIPEVLGQRGGSVTYPMELKTDRPGGDYRDFELANADPKACAAACAREAECRAWTYGKPGFAGEKAHCWLKNEVPEPVAHEDCTSGLKSAGTLEGMEFNINRMGADYKDMELAKAEPRACQAACEREAKCVAWTYVKPGVQGDLAHCWLKDQVPEPNEDENCVSGVKRKRFQP